ncbi:MAG: PASTA domain-containing protein [Actinomycetota bacterium]
MRTKKVPDLSCLTVEAANQALENEDLLRGTLTTEISDDCGDVGLVLSQSIAPGEEVPPGTTVDLVISGGPETVILGDYTCRNFNAAKNQLEQLDLVVVYGGTAPMLPQCSNPNFVALQDPAPGIEVEVGSTVTLYTGEEPTPSPTASPT